MDFEAYPGLNTVKVRGSKVGFVGYRWIRLDNSVLMAGAKPEFGIFIINWRVMRCYQTIN